jgi:hypothetical protein
MVASATAELPPLNMPSRQCLPLLQASLQRMNTYVSTQVCDDQDRTIGVVRTTLVVEQWGDRPLKAVVA